MNKIVIVDDSASIVNVMKCCLERAGYEVDTVIESATVFDGRVTEFDPDLLILDINMPRFDGFYVLEMVKKLNTCPRAKVVMCSTKFFEQDMNRAKVLGAVDFLVKPFNDRELIEKVVAVIGEP